ncbi:TetR/AcrR family transcriptional regulator [Salinispira pacifica]
MSDRDLPARRNGKRKQRALETRRRIFESALALFRERGYENVSVDDIAARAGTAKGSFYTYFNTKSDVITEEFRSVEAEAAASAADMPEGIAATERLTGFVSGLLDYYHRRVGHQNLAVLYHNQLIGSASVRIVGDPYRPTVDALASIIAEGQRTGEFHRGEDARLLAGWVNRALRGLYIDWTVARGSFHLRKEGMRYFSATILNGLISRQ